MLNSHVHSSLRFSFVIYLILMLAHSLFLCMQSVNDINTSKCIYTYLGTH